MTIKLMNSIILSSGDVNHLLFIFAKYGICFFDFKTLIRHSISHFLFIGLRK